MQADLFQSAAEEADEASFYSRARRTILADLRGRFMLFEAMRMHCQRLGIQPPHHNCWGKLADFMRREGEIQMTTVMQPSRDPRSHGRRQPVWRVIG